MNLANTLNKNLKDLGVRNSKFADACGVPNSAMTNALSGRPVRVKTMKKLMSYPDLTSEQVNRLAVAWIEDRRTDLGMNTDDFHITPSEGQTIIRITGDPVLVQALREIGIEAMKDRKVYDMVMAIRDAVVGEK
jgi:hypothetical protein